jgi:8-oxo-dGTP pyrophosphatase MutT (NUDIX family)
MNRKLYFNDKFIEFVGSEMQAPQNQSFKFYESIQNENALKKIVEDFLDGSKKESIRIYNQDFKKVLNNLKKYFHYIEAAGGLIEKNKEYLIIRRHGIWDLPKGKMEDDETIEECAIRECEEECGIKNLKIIKPLSSTFHIYPHKKGVALKQSFWFYMTTDYSKKLVPQTEENIDMVKWFKINDIKNTVLKDTYYTISDVIKEGLSL